MRAIIASLSVLAVVACQPVPQDPPVDQAVLASLDAGCDLHAILDERTFISQPSLDDPRRERANQQLVAACIAAGGDINALNDWGRSPLGAAAYWGDLDSMRKLIAAGADPNRFGRGSYHPVASAVIGSRGGDTEVLKLLLDAGGNPNGSATARNDDPQPLATAIWDNDPVIVRMLIVAGANVAIRDRSNGHSMVERTLLSDDDNGEILTMLFQAGLSPTAPLSRGRTPLERVLGKGNPGELRALARAGVDVAGPVDGYPNPLFRLRGYATNAEFVRTLVRLGADPRATDSFGKTPFQAAERFDTELVAIFRQAGIRR